MAKQYVGARYVPKFASPVEWVPSTYYEALTIVTFNNASYTSKVPVPPTVGNPANNPQYWALTGNYNAQIAANKKALQTPTTVTDPTSKTVLLAGSQGIDYSKLADAIIAKYQGQTLAGKAQSVKSALDTVRSVQDQTIKAEDSSAPCSYSAGDFFVYDGKLYKASADFSSVTLTADNISQYAEAQTQTAINALNQNLLSGVRIVEHWKYRPAYEIPVDGQLELDFSKYVNDERQHPYGDNFLIFVNTVHYIFGLIGFISLVSATMTFCGGIIESGLSLSFTSNDDHSIHTIIIKNKKPYTAGIKDVYILRLS